MEEASIINQSFINNIIKISNQKVDFWDISYSVNHGTILDFTDKKSKEISYFELHECGIRSFYDGGWGFVTLANVNKKSILDGFEHSIKLARLTGNYSKEKFKITSLDPVNAQFEVKQKKKLEDISIEEKIDIVKFHEKNANSYSNKIKNTRTLYTDAHKNKTYFNSFGSNITQKSSVIRLFNLVFTQESGNIQKSVNSIGGNGGFEIVETTDAQNLSSKSCQEALDLLDAKSPVGGRYRVIMDPKLTGTFIHEAFGHAIEGDIVLNKESLLQDKIGLQVAQEDIIIIDDPRIGFASKLNLPYELFGSYFVDDEGIPSQKTTIIENGILKNYLHNLETSSRMNKPPNGHGRAFSSTSKPQVRMGVTYIEPGDWELEEMVQECRNGILCEDFQYGYTDPTTGNFTFRVKLSYIVENGEKKDLMRDVSLSGMTLEVLNRVSALGNEKTLKFSDGMCGKGGQRVPVCDGGPFIMLEDFTVGGLN